jgi:dihydroorotase
MTHRPLLFKGGRVVDPSQKLDGVRDLLLVEGKIAALDVSVEAVPDAQEIDAAGMIITPGLIDVHVHLREPGQEHKETIATGARSAAAGGFTAVCSMPNTDPPIDDPASVGFVVAQAKAARSSRVYPMGAITVGLKGESLTEIGSLKEAGAVGVTDDGQPVMDSGIMRMALEYAQAFDMPVVDHPEDLTLSRDGAMNEGLISTRLGLKGKPNASEDIHIIRDILLAELTGGRIHIQHVSTRFGVDAIRQGKARGVRVTGEASPHHMLLTDEDVDGYRTEAKMNPPLRSPEDRDAVLEGMKDGTLDVIATDHAPHHYDEKEAAFDDAPNGIVGLETALGLVYGHLVEKGVIDLATMVMRMSVTPAKLFNLPGGTLTVGHPADVTVFDPDGEWTVDPATFESKSGNTPFKGWTLKGKPRYTVVGGEVVWEAE